MARCFRWGSLGLVLIALPWACRGGSAPSAPPAPQPLIVGAENLVELRREEIRTGPRVVGSLEAQEQATVRAEVSGSIETADVELGQPVKRRQVLARIEDLGVRDAHASARSAVAAARQDLVVANRQVERTRQLVDAGALAERDLEVAQSSAAAARSRLAQAQAELATATRQLEATIVRSPIDGIVSQRSVGAGDVVSPGSPLFTIIDPSSMQLRASVPSAELASLEVGTSVEFEVRGYPQRTFMGRIERVAPAADPATGQIPILVEIPNTEGTLVAGLFAEGRVTTEVHEGLVAPLAAVDTTGPAPTVLRVRDNVVERVPVETGVRDEISEEVELKGDLQAGDRLLTGVGGDVAPGTPVEMLPSR